MIMHRPVHITPTLLFMLVSRASSSWASLEVSKYTVDIIKLKCAIDNVDGFFMQAYSLTGDAE